MRQAVMVEPGKIEIRNVVEPKVGSDEILLRIKRIGICGSDIHVYHGKHPFTKYPVVQGHEYCGVVESVGERVTDIQAGMLATARPQLVCGKCNPCLRGDYNVCEKLRVQGFQAPGCAQDLFTVPEDRIVVLPEGLTYEQGALIEPASVGCHCTARARNLENNNVVIIGAGTVGNLIAQVVKARGAAKILVVDLSDYRLDVVQRCGIEFVSNPAKERLKEAVKRVFGDEGFQVAIEAAGAQKSLSAVVDSIEKGGRIIIVGVYEQPPEVNMSVVCEHELTLIGSMMYKHEDYIEAAEMIVNGKINTEPLVTKHFPFEKYLDAYKFIDAQGDRSLKVMIDL